MLFVICDLLFVIRYFLFVICYSLLLLLSLIFNYILLLLAIIGIIMKASINSLEFSWFRKYSRAPPCPLLHIYYCYLLYIIVISSLGRLMPRHDNNNPPSFTFSLLFFSYPTSFRHLPPASSCELRMAEQIC